MYVDFDVGNESVAEFFQKTNKQTNKQKKAVSLHEAYKSPVHKKLKEGEAI